MVLVEAFGFDISEVFVSTVRAMYDASEVASIVCCSTIIEIYF